MIKETEAEFEEFQRILRVRGWETEMRESLCRRNMENPDWRYYGNAAAMETECKVRVELQ